MGNLTRNPVIKINHKVDDVQVGCMCVSMNIFKDLELYHIYIIIMSIGSDAVIVYIIKYMLA